LNMSAASTVTIVTSGFRPYSIKARKNPIPEIPSHWIFERDGHPSKHTYFCWSPFMHFLHHLFCVIGLGHASLHHVWEDSHPDCSAEVWEHGRDMLRERLQHINIVAGLLLSSVTAFCTTVPPDGAILPYTMTAPYCVLLVSVALALGALIVGSSAVFVIHKAKVEWFNETMMSSRTRIWGTMLLLSFPFLSVGASTCTAAAGLLIAASRSEATFVRVSCYFLVVPPILCGLAAGWMLCMTTGALGRLIMRLPRIRSPDCLSVV